MPDQDLTLTIGASADGVEETLNEVKSFLSDTSEAAKSLSDMVGSNLSNSLQQVSGAAQVVGPSLSAAFSPLQIISFAQAIYGAAKSLSALISDTFIYTQAEKEAYAQELSVNGQILKMVENTKQLRRERQLLEAPDQAGRNALKEQFLAEDQGTSKDIAKTLNQKIKELQDEQRKMVTVGIGDAATGMTTEMPMLFSETEEGQQSIRKLNDDIGILKAKMDQVTEAERLLADQNKAALDADAIQRSLAAQVSGQRELQSLDIVSLSNLHSKSVISAAIANQKKQEEKDDANAAKALASANAQAAAESEKYLATQQKQSQTADKIDQLTRDIQDSAAQHNARLAVAMGYMTEEQAAQQALKQLETDKDGALGSINAKLSQQIEVVRRLGQETMNGILGSPQQRAAYQKAVTDYQNLKIQQLDLEKKYDNQIAAEQMKLTNTFSAQLRRQALEWQNVQKEMGQVFFSTINSMNSSLASFIVSGQANWKQLATSAIEEIIKIGLQWIESHTIMAAMNSLFAAQQSTALAAQNVGKIMSASFVAAANAYAANAAFPPAAVAAAAAAAAAVQAMAGGAAAAAKADAAKFELGGIVPATGLALVHQGEKILPASMSGRGDFGAAGITVVVNHSVNAVDAESFQGVIRRHGNIIGNEVARVLRKRGIAP